VCVGFGVCADFDDRRGRVLLSSNPTKEITTMQRTMYSRTTPALNASSIPSELESPRAKLVYLFLSTHGEATITELQSSLNMKKISLYSILSTLCERGLIDQDAESYSLC
jgi:DNA-binding MarR family transcriptional regulator